MTRARRQDSQEIEETLPYALPLHSQETEAIMMPWWQRPPPSTEQVNQALLRDWGLLPTPSPPQSQEIDYGWILDAAAACAPSFGVDPCDIRLPPRPNASESVGDDLSSGDSGVVLPTLGLVTTSLSREKETFVDLFINAISIRTLHFFSFLAIGITYSIFDHLIESNGRSHTYFVIDWCNSLGSAITCFLGLIFYILVHLLLYGLYRAWRSFPRKLTSHIDNELESDSAVIGNPGDKEDSSIIPKSQ